MKSKTFSRFVFALVGGAGLLLLGLWLWSAPQASTAELFPLYSPIHPVGDPQIVLEKTINNPNPQVGDEVVYTLTYANTNPGSQAFNVRLYEFLPAGVQFLSSNPVADLSTGGALLFTAPSVGPTTDSVQVTVRVRILEGFEELHNHALVMADGIDPVSARLRTEVTQPPRSLRLTKTGYSAVLVGDELVYTLMTQNTGDSTVNDVRLVDVLPQGLPLISASPSPDEVRLPLISWLLGDLTPGERRSVVFTTTAPLSPTVITNTALADARQLLVTDTLFTTQVVDQGAILRITKSGSAPVVQVGDQLVYTLRYENAGNETATDVTVVDTFPADISVDSADPTTLSLTDAQGSWNLGTLDPGESGQIVITTTVGGSAGRTLLNVADISAQPGSFPEHAELETDVTLFTLRLPLLLKNY